MNNEFIVHHSRAIAPANSPISPTKLPACLDCVCPEPEAAFEPVGAVDPFVMLLAVGVVKLAGMETLFCAAQTLGSWPYFETIS